MKKIFRKEVIIGFTVIVALLVLFFGIEYLKGVNVFKPTNYYYASYTNVSGLTVSAPITVNGFKVGLVREINYEYDNPGHVLVEMSLDEELRITQGTKAELVTDMLGTASIQLLMNDTTAYHEIGDKLIATNATGLMDNISQEVLPSVTSIMPKIDTLLTSINTLVSDPAIASSVKRLDKITANLEATSSQLNKMMKAMTPAVENVNGIAQNLNGITAKVEAMPLDSTVENIEQLTENIKTLTEQLNSENSSLGLLLNDTKLYDNLNNAAGSLDSLLIDVKKNPKRYISIKLL